MGKLLPKTWRGLQKNGTKNNVRKLNRYISTLKAQSEEILYVNTQKMVPRDHIFTVSSHTLSLLIEKDLCEGHNVSIKFPWSLSEDFIFFSKSFHFLFLFLCYLYFGTFPFHVFFKRIILWKHQSPWVEHLENSEPILHKEGDKTVIYLGRSVRWLAGDVLFLQVSFPIFSDLNVMFYPQVREPQNM